MQTTIEKDSPPLPQSTVRRYCWYLRVIGWCLVVISSLLGVWGSEWIIVTIHKENDGAVLGMLVGFVDLTSPSPPWSGPAQIAKGFVVFGIVAVVLRLSGLSGYFLRQGLWIAGVRGLCKNCLYPLCLPAAGSASRCPECGTVNDASKWLINLEGKSDEGQESA